LKNDRGTMGNIEKVVSDRHL